MASLAPVLSCQNITKRFDNAEAPAVNRVSFDLHKGDLLGLLGPSGCGKTTLLRLMAGFERPDTGGLDTGGLDTGGLEAGRSYIGNIELSGQRVCGQGEWVPPERRQVGVVFQDYALFPHLCVLENVAFGLKQLCRRGKLPKSQIQVLADEAIQLVGLSGMAGRYPHELSGGQQQRVALARALAPRPPLILLDEPFSNLDVQVRLRLRQEVRDILKNVGASGIFVTHDQEEALAIADKVAVMQAGRLVQLDTPEAIYQRPQSRFVAEFVTQGNFLPVTRLQSDSQSGSQNDSQSRWQSPLGPLQLASQLVADADHGEVMIAQEDLEIVDPYEGCEQGHESAMLIQGRQFLGRVYQYSLLMASGQVLQVRSPIHQRLDVGDRVAVKINGENVRFFSA
jgi:iron(III) transport system ATP-binding protein